MKKIKNSLEEMLKDKKIWIFFGIVLIFFGGMFKVEYSSDSYLFFQQGWEPPFTHFLQLGRFLSAFFWLLLCKTNFTFMYIVSYVLALIFATLSIYKLNKLLERDIKNKFITGLISVLIVLNAFSLELMLFYEKAILILSVLFNILAIKKLDDFFTNKKMKDFWICFVYMLLAYFSYQGTVALFLSLRSCIYFKTCKRYKRLYNKNGSNRIIILDSSSYKLWSN